MRPLASLPALVFATSLASPLAAQSTTAVRTMPVSGSVPQFCTMQPGKLQAGGLVNINGLDGDTLSILQLVDPQTLAAKAASASVSFESACNFPHQLRIESQNNGLWPTDGRMAAVDTGFAYALPYEASVSWADASGTLSTDAKVRTMAQQLVNVPSAASGDLIVRLQLQQGASNVGTNAPVLAGAYGDTLRIYLEPR